MRSELPRDRWADLSAAPHHVRGLQAFYLLASLWFAFKAVYIVVVLWSRPAALFLDSDWMSSVIDVLPRDVGLATVTGSALVAGLLAVWAAAPHRSSAPLRGLIFLVSLAVNSLDNSEGSISHWNHFLMLGLLFGVPIGVGSATKFDVRLWELGLVTPYLLTGYWKLRQAVSDVLQGTAEGSWLDEGGLVGTVRANEVRFDRPVAGLELLEWMSFLMPGLFLATSVVFLLSPLLLFGRRSRIGLTALIVAFHLFNWWTLQAQFWFVAVLVAAALLPPHMSSLVVERRSSRTTSSGASHS